MVLLALVAIVAGLRAASPVLIPVVVGVALATLLWPVQKRLSRAAPRVVAFLCCVLLVLAGLAAGLGLVWLSLDALGEQAPRFTERLEQARESLRSALASRGIPAGDVLGGSDVPSGTGGAGGEQPSEAQSGAGAQQESASQQGSDGTLNGQAASWVGSVIRTLVSGSALLGLAIAFFALGLWEVGDFQRRLRHDLGSGGQRAFAIAERIAHEFRRFAGVKTVTSAITGISTGIATWLLGVEHPWIWGLAAFALEYLPTIGSFIAIFPPVLYSLVQFDGLLRPVIVLVTIGALQLILGNYVDPKIEGRFLSLSPAVVLLAIVFWGWVWGVAGALLGVPITLAIVIEIGRAHV